MNAEVLTSDGSRVALGKFLGGGAEGSVYELGSWRAAKIYRESVLSKRGAFLREKVQFLSLIGRRLPTEPLHQVIWPKGILLDNSGAFLGFEMDKPRDVTNLARQATFATWDLAERAEAGRQLARIYAHLHAAGFLVADGKTQNALYCHAKRRVFLADVDSLHHAQYPAQVVSIASLQPSVYRQGAPYLASLDADNHALAVQLFALLVRNQHPYAAGASIEECVKQGVFLYPYMNNGSAAAVVRADSLEAWTNLSDEQRALFSQAFHDNSPPDAAVWQRALSQPSQNGDSGSCPDTNKLSLPTSRPSLLSRTLAAVFGGSSAS